MKYKVGDWVYSSLYNEKGFVDHINISSGEHQYWVKPDNNSCQFIALEGQIKQIVKLKAELA